MSVRHGGFDWRWKHAKDVVDLTLGGAALDRDIKKKHFMIPKLLPEIGSR